jgi:hypothetical protein
MLSENCDQLKQGEDKRAPWERPVFRRLAASDADKSFTIDDGNCIGISPAANHSGCFN